MPRAGAAGVLKGVFHHHAADAAADLLGALRRFVQRARLALAPFRRAVGVADSHAHHADGGMDAANGTYSGNTPAGAQDHLSAHLFAQDRVGTAHVGLGFRGDGGGLQPQAVGANGLGRVKDNLVLRRAPVGQAQVIGFEMQIQADH